MFIRLPILAALFPLLFQISCAEKAGKATVSDFRKVTHAMTISGDCHQLALFNNLNNAQKIAHENGFKENCTGQDATNLNSYLVQAHQKCTEAEEFTSVLEVSEQCGTWVNSVKAQLEAQSRQATGSGPITKAELSVLALKAIEFAECIGYDQVATLLMMGVDEDDVAAFTQFCNRDDYLELRNYLFLGLVACENSGAVGGTVFYNNSDPVLSGPGCQNLVDKVFGD